jgi:uncharacterized membrane protein YuzA (DUF378 family)
MKLKTADWIAYVLTVVGGLNWGLVGAFEFNLVDTLFGEESALSRIVYILVGLSAVYLLLTASKLAGGARSPMAD